MLFQHRKCPNAFLRCANMIPTTRGRTGTKARSVTSLSPLGSSPLWGASPVGTHRRKAPQNGGAKASSSMVEQWSSKPEAIGSTPILPVLCPPAPGPRPRACGKKVQGAPFGGNVQHGPRRGPCCALPLWGNVQHGPRRGPWCAFPRLAGECEIISPPPRGKCEMSPRVATGNIVPTQRGKHPTHGPKGPARGGRASSPEGETSHSWEDGPRGGTSSPRGRGPP